ncbi:hypothetical protein DASC09_036850 [Saccharomycopsis crataegensis]|uniref:SMP-30/Gluconolactonase/LRE-like region domain-containing protein n=1 Tax=Saccharomycopsis crataegensis TaxID=43959 RepID=A0AAV5QP74_9ASCO|nr:hypothetical protein DASC09_036850 [Saccharomycopsis crataegensis]
MDKIDNTETEVPLFTSPGARLSEGTTYNPQNNSLLWIDIAKGELHRVELPKGKKQQYSESDLNTIANSHEVVKYKEDDKEFIATIGGIALTSDIDIIVAAATQGIAKIDFKTLTFEYKYKFDFIPEDKREFYRSNDSKMSPCGNFWIGIMSNTFKHELKPEGYLAKFDVQTKKFTVLLDNLNISNGMAWSKDLTKFYHVDMTKVTMYKYNKATDSISDPEIFLESKKLGLNIEFDGMTIDDSDNLYIALWDGSGILKVSPEGHFLHKYSYPARRTTCPTIGGAHMDELFVSTADLNLDDTSKLGSVADDLGGSIFRTKIEGVKGRAKYIWEGEV